MKMTNVLEVNPDVPVKTVAEYIAYAKANPGKINFGSGGVGTSPHHVGRTAQVDDRHQHRPGAYRGTAPAVTDLLAGQVQSVFDNIPGSIGHIKAGKLRALGVTAPKRVAALPDVPAIGETVPGYDAERLVWHRGAEGHAARDRRQAQCGGQRGAEGSQAAGRASTTSAPSRCR